MKESTKLLTRSAISVAAGFVILYLSVLIPAGRIGFLCLSSLAVVFVLMSCGWKWALGCFASTAILSLLLLPNGSVSAAYALFCGWYPVLKTRLERIPQPASRWIFKFLIFNAVFVPAGLLLKKLFLSDAAMTDLSYVALLLGGNAVFLLYDYACKLVFLYYIRNIARRLK